MSSPIRHAPPAHVHEPAAAPHDLRERAGRLGLWGLGPLLDRLDEAALAVAAQVIEAEETERRRRSLERRLRCSRIGLFKPLADFDWSWPKKCDRALVEDLMTLDFMKDHANVLLIGPNGTGKTMIAKNIAHRAVLAGHTVRVTTASSLLSDLAAQETASSRQRRLAHYAKPALLAIDELGYLSYDNRYADLLFEVISARYETRSTVITTNRPFSEWTQVFPNAACVVTLVDRLAHCVEVVHIDAQSFRLREARARAERKASERAARRKS